MHPFSHNFKKELFNSVYFYRANNHCLIGLHLGVYFRSPFRSLRRNPETKGHPIRMVISFLTFFYFLNKVLEAQQNKMHIHFFLEAVKTKSTTKDFFFYVNCFCLADFIFFFGGGDKKSLTVGIDFVDHILELGLRWILT